MELNRSNPTALMLKTIQDCRASTRRMMLDAIPTFENDASLFGPRMEVLTSLLFASRNETAPVFARYRSFVNQITPCQNVRSCIANMTYRVERARRIFAFAFRNVTQLSEEQSRVNASVVECRQTRGPTSRVCRVWESLFKQLLFLEPIYFKREEKFLEDAKRNCTTEACRDLLGVWVNRTTVVALSSKAAAESMTANALPWSVSITPMVLMSIVFVIGASVLVIGVCWGSFKGNRGNIFLLSMILAVSSCLIVLCVLASMGDTTRIMMGARRVSDVVVLRIVLLAFFFMLLYFCNSWVNAIFDELVPAPRFRKVFKWTAIVVAVLVSIYVLVVCIGYSLFFFDRLAPIELVLSMNEIVMDPAVDQTIIVLCTLALMVSMLGLGCCIFVARQLRADEERKQAVKRMTIVFSIIFGATLVFTGIEIYFEYGYYVTPEVVQYVVALGVCNFLVLCSVLATIVFRVFVSVHLQQHQRRVLEKADIPLELSEESPSAPLLPAQIPALYRDY